MASRREFLQAVGASTLGALTFTGCQPTGEFVAQSRVRLPEDLVSAYEDWYATSCEGCGAGCGTIVRVVAGRAKKVEGIPEHPLNQGRTCARGQAAVQEQYHPDRIPGPLMRRGPRGAVDGFFPVTWDDALDRVATNLRELYGAGRGNEVAMLTQPLGAHRATLLDRFTQAYGARWLRLDPLPQTPVRTAVERVFGIDRLPAFDIQRSRYVLSFGADFLSTWLSPVHYGYEYGIFRQGYYQADRFAPRTGQQPRGHLVQVEPRFSMTAANADEWVWIRPGMEGLLALSMLQVIVSEGLGDPAGVAMLGSASGLDQYAPEQVAVDTGVGAERVRRIAREFAQRGPSLALAGGLAAAHTNGTENLAAVYALNLAVGSVGRPGGVLPNPPPVLGLPPTTRASTLSEWQDLTRELRAGQVQTVLIHDANPVYGLPAGLQVQDALHHASLIVSFSSFMDETTALADLVLPSHLPLEDWGDSIPDPGPGLQVLTMQQPVVRPFFDTRSVWDVLLVLAEEIGGEMPEALPWPTFQSMLKDGARELMQHTAQAAPAADPRSFDYFWVQLLQQGGWWEAPRAELQEPSVVNARTPLQLDWRPPVLAGNEAEFPFYLAVFAHNSWREGRASHLPWMQAAPDPVTTVVWQSWVEVNPRLADRLDLEEGDLVAVETPVGRAELPVYVSPAAPPDVLSIPMGQGHAFYGRWASDRGVNPMQLLAPLVDRSTGALAYAATRARLIKLGKRVQLPKLEGTEPARQVPNSPVLEITTS